MLLVSFSFVSFSLRMNTNTKQKWWLTFVRGFECEMPVCLSNSNKMYSASQSVISSVSLFNNFRCCCCCMFCFHFYLEILRGPSSYASHQCMCVCVGWQCLIGNLNITHTSLYCFCAPAHTGRDFNGLNLTMSCCQIPGCNFWMLVCIGKL